MSYEFYINYNIASWAISLRFSLFCANIGVYIV